jgi:divalent metal cation (Fe/Co/Zn/Cd) transporter
VVAVSFAAYSLWLSRKPPDPSHLYGHDKIAFFSAGFEGAMIVLAAFIVLSQFTG